MSRIARDSNAIRHWDALGRRLREVDPDEYNRLCNLARAFVKVHDEPLTELEYQALYAAIGGPKASA